MEYTVRIKRYDGKQVTEVDDSLAVEFRTNLYVNGEHYISIMCLPQHLEELAVGFLYSEGLIRSREDIISIADGGRDDILAVVRNIPDRPRSSARVVLSGFAKGSVNLPFFGDSQPDTDPIRPQAGTYEGNSQPGDGPPSVGGAGYALPQIHPADVADMIARFQERSALFRRTGAVHSCSLVLPDGTVLFYEDVGRHNALDKIVGRALLDDLRTENGILLTSGRVSSEILMKAAGLGIPVIISTSAPTDMAVRLARAKDVTLIGFARGDRFNLYAGDSRVTL